MTDMAASFLLSDASRSVPVDPSGGNRISAPVSGSADGPRRGMMIEKGSSPAAGRPTNPADVSPGRQATYHVVDETFGC